MALVTHQTGVVRVWADPWSSAWETLIENEAPENSGWVEVDAHCLAWMIQRSMFAPANSILRVRTDSLYQELNQLCVLSQAVLTRVVTRAGNLSKVIEWNGHRSRMKTVPRPSQKSKEEGAGK